MANISDLPAFPSSVFTKEKADELLKVIEEAKEYWFISTISEIHGFEGEEKWQKLSR